MFNLYRHIEQLAKDRGIPNISRLCSLAEVPRSVMSELSTGRSQTISIRTAEKFAEVLGVPVDTVFGRDQGSVTSEDLVFALLDGDIDGFTPEMLQEVKRYAQYIRTVQGSGK